MGGPNARTPRGHAGASFWLHSYWGSPGQFGRTLLGTLRVLTILPWTRGSNRPGVSLGAAVFATAFAPWFRQGPWDPEQGDALDDAYPAITRAVPQLARVAAVRPRDDLHVAWGGDAPVPASPPTPPGVRGHRCDRAGGDAAVRRSEPIERAGSALPERPLDRTTAPETWGKLSPPSFGKSFNRETPRKAQMDIDHLRGNTPRSA